MLRPAPLLLIAGSVWTTLVIAAPLLGWSAVYVAAHMVCHQLPARTFHLPAGALAVCARCLGLYLGAVAGGLSSLLLTAYPPRGMSSKGARRLVTIAVVPTLATLAAEWLLGWPVTNAIRFTGALPLGWAAAWVVVRALEVDWRA